MLETTFVSCLNNRGLPDCWLGNLNSEFVLLLLPLGCVKCADIFFSCRFYSPWGEKHLLLVVGKLRAYPGVQVQGGPTLSLPQG